MDLILALLLAVPPPAPAAEAALEKRDWARAEKLFREAIVRDPKDDVAWHELGAALDHLGRSGEAAQAVSSRTAAAAAPGRIGWRGTSCSMRLPPPRGSRMRITTSQSFFGAPAIALARKRSIAPHWLLSAARSPRTAPMRRTTSPTCCSSPAASR
jgi:hypothetical protein